MKQIEPPTPFDIGGEHKLMENRRRESTKGEIQMFAGLVKCSNCGSSLNASYNTKKQKYTGFSCWVYKNYGKERCTSHAIGWQTMCSLVLENIRFHAGIAARQSKVYLDKRNSLVVESIKIIKDIKPRFFIFENVAAFMKTACTDIDGEVKSISDTIHSNLGKQYSIASQIINFKNYGACSSRTRTIVIGIRMELAYDIAPIELFPDFVEERTLRETIGYLMPLNTLGEVDPNDIYHAFRPYPEHMRAWVSELKEGQSAFENTDLNRIPHKIVDGKIVYNQQKNGDKYRRQFWDKVGPCIHTRNDQFASQNTIHPADDRVFSIHELMKIMTIPDDFKWVELSLDELNKLSVHKKQALLKKEEIKIRQSLGEAVPTAIFRSIAKNIGSFLDKAHLVTSEVNKEIEKHGLSDDGKLISYIKKNEKTIGVSSLSRIAENANAKRTQHAAFFTDKFLVSEIIDNLPMFQKQTVRILEPSVGAGNFIPLLARKYMHIETVVLDVVDVDPRALEVLKTLISAMCLPANLKINYIWTRQDHFLCSKLFSLRA